MRYLLLRLKRFCGFITGLVFFIGGILKLMDPVGTGLIMDKYLDFLHIGFFGFASKPLAVLFALAETVVGTAMITGVWRKTTAIIALSLQGFFTLLTILLAIFNPVMDCGCFGEAIHLTHMETFGKNIILLTLLLVYYIPRKHLGQTTQKKYISFSVVATSVLAFTIFSWMFKPLVEFTAYQPGVELIASGNMLSEDIYESVFTYEKDGVKEDFTLGHLPDSTWTFVSTHTRQINQPDDLSVELSFYNSESGEYLDSLAVEGKVMIVSVYSPSELSEKKWNNVRRFIEESSRTGFHTMLLTSTTEGVPDGLQPYLCDFKTLVSLNRSNGGSAYFNDGMLIEKWSRRRVPTGDILKEKYESNPTEILIFQENKGSLVFQGFLLYVFAVMLLM